jgi:hypothetical protein
MPLAKIIQNGDCLEVLLLEALYVQDDVGVRACFHRARKETIKSTTWPRDHISSPRARSGNVRAEIWLIDGQK